MREVGKIDDVLREVRAHVVETGHTKIYPVEWRPTGARGFACQDCEEADQAFEIGVGEEALMADPRASTIFNRDAISAWLEATKLPPLTDFERILGSDG